MFEHTGASALMTVATIALEALIVVALVGLIAFRQVKGQYADARSVWKAPAVLAAIGLATIPATVSGFRAVDAILLTVEVVVCVLLGVGMGRLTSASVAAASDRRGRQVRVRTGWSGAALWVVFVVIRLALRPVAVSMHAEFVTSVGVTLVLIAITRAVTARIVIPRIEQASQLTEASAEGVPRS